MPTATSAIRRNSLRRWTSPAFDNEDERPKNTETMIARGDREVTPCFRPCRSRTYAKGSYKNKTNVRRDSDVDVAVEYTGIIFTITDPKRTRERSATRGNGVFRSIQNVLGETRIEEFKDAVGDALPARSEEVQ